MYKTNTRILFLLFLFFSQLDTKAQLASGMPFRFSTATHAVTPTVPTLINLASRPAAIRDEFDTLLVPAGFSFTFAGVIYDRVIISSNGWVALAPSTVSTLPAYFASPLPNNSLSTYAGGLPLIAPLWDNDSCAAIQYGLLANVLTIRWSVKWDKTYIGAYSPLFWVVLDGNTGNIDMYYSTAAYTPSATAGASIGIAGVCTGDFYSVTPNATLASTSIDSVAENSTVNLKPVGHRYSFIPYNAYDNCSGTYPAQNLGTINATCTYKSASTYNATVSGAGNCSTADDNDVWFRFIKPNGVLNVTVTTAPSICQSVTGTSVEIYSACGGAVIGCATTSTGYPGYGEVVFSRPCAAETLWVRVTADGDIPGKFLICAKEGGSGSSGNTCANATPICSIPYSQTGLSTLGFGNEYDSTNSACHDPFMNGEDYLFSYTPTANGCIRVVVNSTGDNPGVFVFNGCPNLLTTNCIASSVNSTGTLTINSVSLVAGVTYYFLVDNNPAGVPLNNIPFDINITSVGGPQTYDACGAVNLGSIANNQACTFSTYTTECATASALVYPNPGCGSYANNVTGDVWLSFTATFTGSLLIRTQPGATNPTSDLAMAVYTGNCISLTLFACDDNSAGSGMPLLSLPVVSGTVYYIRLWTAPPGNSGSFDLCLTSACTPPNDLPCAAVLVNLGGTASGFNTCASSTSEPLNAAQCVAGGIINTVWYKAVVPASGSIKVRTHTRTLSDTQIQGFSFPTGCANAATSFIARTCNDDGPDCGAGGPQSFHDFSEQLFSGLTPGDTLYIAVDGYNSQTGTFDITIINGTGTYPPVPGADCEGSYEVCGSSNITVPDPGILGYGNICDFGVNYNCWNNPERNSAWYRVTVNPGTLQFDIQTFSDYDFIMWDITGISNPCAQIQSISLPSVRCNWVTTTGGSTGISIADPDASWEPAITITGSPRTYMILIDNWNPPYQTTGFTLDWMGSPIASTTTSVTWQGAADTSFSTLSNWGVAPCNAVPSCNIDATVASAGTGRQPTISANMAVNNFTINAGGSLRIMSPFRLDVCGNFTNNGTLICEPGSSVRFIGTGIQTINGTLTGTNSFANVDIFKASGSVVLNANIDVNGNFITSSPTSIFSINGKYMRVAGNFTNNNGTTTFTGIGASTLEFYGGLNQNFTNSSGLINLNRVRMNKSTGKTYLTGINSTMNIDSVLTLTSGNLVTSGILEVNVKYGALGAITGHSSNSFVNGRLRRKMYLPSAVLDFPVGDSLVPNPIPAKGYNLATITFSSSTVIPDLLCYFSVWPSPPPNGPAASECVFATYNAAPIFNNGFWTFQRPTSSFGGNYNVTLNNTGFTNNVGMGWTVSKADIAANPLLPASWGLLGTCVIASTAASTQRTSMNFPVLTTSSFNCLYATVQSTQPLAVELIYFSAEPQGEIVMCKWETASETNNDYFEVERSFDGNNFEFLGRVEGFGQGVSNVNIKYSFPDNDLCNDIRYYRLKQVDTDGLISYSEIIAVNCQSKKDFLNVYPNPGNSTIVSSFYEHSGGFVRLEWHDMIGQIVKKEVHQVIKGYNSIDSRIDEIAAGIYYLKIQNINDNLNENVRQVKFIKN
jgi:hypothetical protein